MASPKRIPKMRSHRSGQARVTLNGKTHYLGKWGTPQSHAKYAALIQSWEKNHRQPLTKVATVVEATRVVAMPEEMDFVSGAAFPVVWGTSHVALSHRARLRPGEVLLVLGAAGGVGLSAVEIGKIMGATVIAAAS